MKRKLSVIAFILLSFVTYAQRSRVLPAPATSTVTPTIPVLEWTPVSGFTITGANLIATSSNVSTYSVNGSIGKSSGKFYAEVKYTAAIAGSTTVGVRLLSESNTVQVGSTTSGYSVNDVGQKKNNNTDVSYASAPALNSVIGILLNLVDNEISFRVDNVDVGVAYTGLAAGTYYIAAGSGFAVNQFTIQNTLTYGVPSGYTQW